MPDQSTTKERPGAASYGHPHEPSSDRARSSLDDDGLLAHPAVHMARMWIEDNQTLAVLGAFAVGVFMGVLLRD